MKNHASNNAVLTVALVFGAFSLTACPDPGEDDTGGTTDPTAGDSTTEAVDTVGETVDPDTVGTTVVPDGTTTEGPDTETGDDPFAFPTDPYDAYTQIDRHGAVEAGTAGILASQGLGFNPGSDIALRDDYNASNPEEDAAGMWLPEIQASVEFFHDALDDDMMALGLTPATVDQSLAQAGPVIVPDTIKYDPSMPTSYPNGRALTDPVVDITLAAVMLDLETHSLTTFADLPLNPEANDVPFLDEFPYLAPPHLP